MIALFRCSGNKIVENLHGLRQNRTEPLEINMKNLLRSSFKKIVVLLTVFPTITFANDTVLAPVRCLIEPNEVIELSFPVAGVLQEISVNRGDAINAGQIIARLDGTLEEIQLESAKTRAENLFSIAAREANLEFLNNRAERIQKLAGRNVTAESALEEALVEAEMARQEVEEARLDQSLSMLEVARVEAVLKQKTLNSPLDGLVLERQPSVGEYQDGTQPIVTIAALDPLRVEAFVPISYHSSIQVGQEVLIEPEAPISGSYAAKITVIDQVFDAGTGTVGIRIEIPNKSLSLPAGLRCNVVF
ncbi:efflux RND transporter periplasmic adaptor subunit [uncultured Roseobacter sp.]|uniref:efflux RND transporter periplasmic adaptor subunit n=1 Tax=uncultured Roseobacter sp. TaxID=114847 RepID=UPI002637BFC3|nr:efflux RND transporter periplasmic adaptor subunit [uncultured Roseobacter sp.]